MDLQMSFEIGFKRLEKNICPQSKKKKQKM